MNTPILTRTIVVFFLAVLPLTSHAASFKISWVGASGYSMTGMFSYSDSLVKTHLINASDLDTFSITGFQNKIPIGSFQLDPTRMNFNFDTRQGTLLTGGRSDSTSGQRWNVPNTKGFGFFSGNSFQGFQINGRMISNAEIRIGAPVQLSSIIPSTLTATPNLTIPKPTTSKPSAPIPEPSTFLLLGTGLIGFLGASLYKKKKG